MALEIRNVTAEDLPTVLSINEAAAPAMNSLSTDELRWFADQAAYFRVAVLDDVVGAFLICLTPDARRRL